MSQSVPKKNIIFYLVMIAAGVLSSFLVTNEIANYSKSTTRDIGFWLIIAMPFLIGVIGAFLAKEWPYSNSTLLLLIYLVSTAPLFREGLICILMYSPFALIFSMLACWLTLLVRNRKHRAQSQKFLFLGLVLLPIGFAKLDPLFIPTSPTSVVIQDELVVPLTPDEIWQRIARARFEFDHSQVPYLVRTLMPIPTSIEGLGVDISDQRRIEFHNGFITATITKSLAPWFFEFEFQVQHTGPEFFDQWVQFEKSSFRFEPIDSKHTRVIHTTSYRPRVYPRWYFEPVEKYLAHQTQAFMMDYFFHPTSDLGLHLNLGANPQHR